MVRFAVPAKNSGTVGTVPTVPGATAVSNSYNEMFEAQIVSFYASTATFFLLHYDEWDRVVALPRHKFVTGATLLQLIQTHYN